MAALYAKGLLKLNQEIWVESITGGLFGGRLIGETTVGNRKAVLPEIKGCAYITGFHQFLIDPDDHLKDGFLNSVIRIEPSMTPLENGRNGCFATNSTLA